MRQLLKIAPGFLLILSFQGISASAKDKPSMDDLASPLSSLYDCSAISDDGARLACFDKATASLKIAEEKKEIVAIDAQSAKKLKKRRLASIYRRFQNWGFPALVEIKTSRKL